MNTHALTRPLTLARRVALTLTIRPCSLACALLSVTVPAWAEGDWAGSLRRDTDVARLELGRVCFERAAGVPAGVGTGFAQDVGGGGDSLGAWALSSSTRAWTLEPEASDAVSGDAASGDAEAKSEDKSGTDPTKFLRTLGLRNEYQRLPNDKTFNVTTFTYIEPFADGRMNLRLKAPFAYTDATGDDEFGLSDLSLRYNWLAYVDATQGLLLGADLTADTASDDVLGRGKWTIGPSVTYAMFLSPTMIFAPAYQHNISFAGDEDRKEVNESVIDFYMVFTAQDKTSWLIVDPTLIVDWETEQNTPLTLEVEYGRNVGSLLGGAFNLYVRPGVGIGQDRPYDWNIEVGCTVVGF
jgi:hypothetical protein